MKRTLLDLLILFCFMGLGVWIGMSIQRSLGSGNVNVVIPDSVIKQETEFIDSLRNLEKEIDSLRAETRDSIQYVIKWKTKEINRVKELPLDSGILYLQKKLRENED